MLRQDSKSFEEHVCKLTSERLVHCIILFRAEWSCGVPGKTSLSGSCCTVDSKPQRLPFPPLSVLPSFSPPIFIPPFQSSSFASHSFTLHQSLPFQTLLSWPAWLLPIFLFVSVHTPNAPAWGEWLLLIPCQNNPNWATA